MFLNRLGIDYSIQPLLFNSCIVLIISSSSGMMMLIIAAAAVAEIFLTTPSGLGLLDSQKM
jgi:hypothetical protein